jgi:beta-lactam-binding protein with PASTA domain
MKRSLHVLLKLALVPIVFFGAMLTAMQFAIHGREVQVPQLVGLTQQQALDATAQQGLLLHIENRFYSKDGPSGSVLTQSPAAGETVRKGLRINVTLSLGSGQ